MGEARHSGLAHGFHYSHAAPCVEPRLSSAASGKPQWRLFRPGCSAAARKQPPPPIARRGGLFWRRGRDNRAQPQKPLKINHLDSSDVKKFATTDLIASFQDVLCAFFKGRRGWPKVGPYDPHPGDLWPHF